MEPEDHRTYPLNIKAIFFPSVLIEQSEVFKLDPRIFTDSNILTVHLHKIIKTEEHLLIIVLGA